MRALAESIHRPILWRAYEEPRTDRFTLCPGLAGDLRLYDDCNGVYVFRLGHGGALMLPKRQANGRFVPGPVKPPVIRTARSRSGQTQQAKAVLRRLAKLGVR